MALVKSRPKAERASTRRKAKILTARTAVSVANAYIVREYPIGVLGNTARRLALDTRDAWIVSIVLTSPGYGVVGEVGCVAVDAQTGEVVGSTPRRQVAAAILRLKETKRHELDAAFRRARTVCWG